MSKAWLMFLLGLTSACVSAPKCENGAPPIFMPGSYLFDVDLERNGEGGRFSAAVKIESDSLLVVVMAPNGATMGRLRDRVGSENLQLELTQPLDSEGKRRLTKTWYAIKNELFQRNLNSKQESKLPLNVGAGIAVAGCNEHNIPLVLTAHHRGNKLSFKVVQIATSKNL